VVLGCALRLAWVLVVPSRPVGDFALYRESAAYLVEHGHLDPEFIYMPGYVFMLAAIQAVGGGLLVEKMLGVGFGTLLVAAASGIADRLFGRRAGITAALLLAVWPAGIAVSSVTGTDVPTGALLATAVFVLVASAPAAPRAPYSWRAAVAAGILFGLAAWIRAVAIPLAGLSLVIWRARGMRWARAAAHALVALGLAVVVLVPWGVRNRRVYGQFFLADSHGGHTALVGANPNSEGTYSRSLNVMFTRGTGFKLFEAPARHRAADAAAYRLVREWVAFEPAYALGLLGAKADRLLTHERNLLYWPIFRAGVLPDGPPPPSVVPETRAVGSIARAGQLRAWFERHRAAVEGVTDAFWWSVAGLFLAGVPLAFLRVPRAQAGLAVATLAVPVALTATYTIFFSEVRYHLAIAPFLFPHAGFALTWLVLRARDRFRRDGSALAVVATVVLGAGALGLLTLKAAEQLRLRHRWAVAVCRLPDPTATQLCAWRRTWPQDGASPLHGVWNGVGLDLPDHEVGDVWAAAETTLGLPPGRYRIQVGVARADGQELAAAPPPRAPTPEAPRGPDRSAWPSVALRVGDTVFARNVAAPERPGQADNVVAGVVGHPGGPMRLEVEVEAPSSQESFDRQTLWISDLSVERFPALEIIPPR
jgi:4-amino-4-deoxy-L-arabinose transferase-like glycosyltransferase